MTYRSTDVVEQKKVCVRAEVLRVGLSYHRGEKRSCETGAGLLFREACPGFVGLLELNYASTGLVNGI